MNRGQLLTTALLLGALAAGGAVLYKRSGQLAPATPALPPTADATDAQLRPNFELPDVNGVAQAISQWDGKVIALNFWATWCGPCRKEIPEFIELQREYGADGLQFIGIAIDQPDPVRDYAAELVINYPLLVGESEAIEVGQAYGNAIGGLPFTAIIDRQGRIVLRKQGVLHRDEAETVIRQLL